MKEFRFKIRYHAFVILISLNIVFSGCVPSIGRMPVYNTKQETLQMQGEEKNTINVQYLGVGGYLFRHGQNALMTAPSITNPSLLKILSLTRLKTNEGLVDRLLPTVEDVEMVLVGHSHYDHLLDVPYVMRKYAMNAVVYGSKTMGHIMAAAVDKSRIIAVDTYAAKGKTPGQWIYNQDRTIRFMAIESEHAPHFAGMKLLPEGPYDKDLKHLPRTVFGWVEGQTYAYLIDFLNEQGNIAFRVHYQDAASTPPLGFVPDLPAKRPETGGFGHPLRSVLYASERIPGRNNQSDSTEKHPFGALGRLFQKSKKTSKSFADHKCTQLYQASGISYAR